MKRIAIEVEGVEVSATLFEDKAPRATELVWGALPLSADLRHARWSGNAAFVAAQALKTTDLGVENQVSFCYPGSLCLLPDRGEIVFAYGQSQARTEAGNVWASHFGTLEGDTSALFAVLAETQRKGRKAITIRRLEA